LAIITGGGKGEFKGDCTIPGHEGEIEVHSVSIGNSGSRTPGTGSGTGQQDTTMTVHISKYVDKSSPQFIRAAERGATLSTATFQYILSDPRGGIKVMRTMEFSDGRVTSYMVSGADPDTGKPLEQIEMEFPNGPS
jgi:type VI secretion system Hcp family effector